MTNPPPRHITTGTPKSTDLYNRWKLARLIVQNPIFSLYNRTRSRKYTYRFQLWVEKWVTQGSLCRPLTDFAHRTSPWSFFQSQSVILTHRFVTNKYKTPMYKYYVLSKMLTIFILKLYSTETERIMRVELFNQPKTQ